MNGEIQWRCPWCFGIQGAFLTTEEAQRGFDDHVKRCRERHLTGSMRREIRKAKGQLARGFETDFVGRSEP